MDDNESDVFEFDFPRCNRQTSRLPHHIIAMLYGTENAPKIMMKGGHRSTGVYTINKLTPELDHRIQTLPWEKDNKLARMKTVPMGLSKIITRREKSIEAAPTKKDSTIALEYRVSSNKYKKVAFVNLTTNGQPLPEWVKMRLQTACMSARYELPANKRLLEELTPLQYLANYTRLYRDQNRRYVKIFDKYKTKPKESIEYKNIYQALSYLFNNFLSEENFNILCQALNMDSDTVLDRVTFIGVCTFADRLYWTAYLDYLGVDTSKIMAGNRTSLEFVDMENLQRKLEDIQISNRMRYLLYSLA